MARPLRIEFADATYHVTSRGDRREPIYVDDADRVAFLELLEHACDRFDADVLAYCLMGNHYHLVLATRQANLSAFMRHLNGVYTQRFNRRHAKVGHVFQGRFKAILVDREAYLLAVCRYVDLNPVRAHMVPAPGDWPWSSYRAHTGTAPAPPWLDTATVLGLVAGPAGYAERVAAEHAQPLWATGLRQQMYLGDEAFVQRMQAQAETQRLGATEVPRAQRAAPQPLSHWLAMCTTREEALRRGHRDSGLSMTAMARQLRITPARVSQLVARAEGRLAVTKGN